MEKNKFINDMMIIQYVNAARKAHLLTHIEDFRKAWRPPDNTINFLRCKSRKPIKKLFAGTIITYDLLTSISKKRVKEIGRL